MDVHPDFSDSSTSLRHGEEKRRAEETSPSDRMHKVMCDSNWPGNDVAARTCGFR